MGRRRVYQISPDTWLVSVKRPKKISGAAAEAFLRDMLEARRIGKAKSFLSPEQRKERARKAARARWGKRPAE
jgi:hypothetical protein